MIRVGNGKVARAREARPLPDDQAFDRNLFLGIRGTRNNLGAAEQDEGEL